MPRIRKRNWLVSTMIRVRGDANPCSVDDVNVVILLLLNVFIVVVWWTLCDLVWVCILSLNMYHYIVQLH